MSKHPATLSGPFLDTYAMGFRLYHPGAPNWRQRTIAGVSWNGENQTAYAFNPDGLALPLQFNPVELSKLLSRETRHREFARITGAGVFAMPLALQQALPPEQLARWVTYWLVAPDAPYANAPQVWREHADRHIAQACEDAAASLAAQIELERRRSATPPPFPGETGTPEPPQPKDDTSQRAASLQAEATRRAQQAMANEHAEQCACDAHIARWLRGDLGTGPALQLMAGAA